MDGIIFDIDGTLWDSTYTAAKAWNEAVKEYGNLDVEITADLLKQEFGKPMDVICSDVFPMLDKKGQEDILELCCKWEHIMLNKLGGIPLGNIKETIEDLAKRHTLYIVSNCQCGYIELVMKYFNIEDLIKDHLCFGETGTSKGQTIFTLMNRNNIKDPVYVGDTDGDHKACIEAGIPFVFAKYGFGHTEDPAYTIERFEELTEMF